ncbi:MAG: dehydrogenase, partial [Nitrospirota bacterium]|nr:dehydrogenase [Nitrospirota bacterium]
MDLIISDLRIPVEKDGADEYIKAASQKLSLGEDDIQVKKILSKSLDISSKEQFCYELSIVVSAPESFDNRENFPLYIERREAEIRSRNIAERPVIIGFGPAGMFAALELIGHG